MRARAALAAGVLAALALAGCGGTAPTTTMTVTEATPTTAAQGVPVERSSSGPPRRAAHHRRAASSGRRACDGNVSVKASTTSCAFGENVFYRYWRAQDHGDDAFDAYSPITKRSYAMTCATGTTVVCRAGDGGEVRFRQAAVDAYDAGQAARYAATHDTGAADAAPPSSGSASAASVQDDAGSGCDPSYEGACLDPDAIDYDCAGGSGDGPEYTGTVTVVGDDHFDLDRDGDGIGCDT